MDYQTQFEWLVVMASNPGWKAHAWHRAQQLDADYPGISQALKDYMIGLAKPTASDGQKAAKHRLATAK